MGACTIEGGYGAARQTAAALGAGFGLLHTAAGRVGALELGFVTEGGLAAVAAAAPKLLFLLGVDETDLSPFDGAFKVYIGTHGDAGARAADVILPGSAYTEKPGTWVNLEGRVQRAERAVFPVGDAREDWTILRALSAVLGKTLPFDNLGELRARIAADYPTLADEGIVLLGRARCRAARRRRVGRDRLPDRRLLPHQPDRALVADDAALLGGTAPRRELRGGRGMTHLRSPERRACRLCRGRGLASRSQSSELSSLIAVAA